MPEVSESEEGVYSFLLGISRADCHTKKEEGIPEVSESEGGVYCKIVFL